MIKICIAGKNNIAVYALQHLLQYYFHRNEILVIPNTTDTGIDTWQKSVYKFAKDKELQIGSLEDAYTIPNLLFISLEFDRIINIHKFATQRLYNIHFSNLPKYKGMYTSVMPLLHGECIAGVTLHKIDSGIDTGDIITQYLFNIDLHDTARDLYYKYLHNGLRLFKDTIQSLIVGNFQAKQQDYLYSSYFSKESIDFSKIRIDFKKTSFEIHNQLRAFIFQEYQLPCIGDMPISHTVLSGEYIGNNVWQEYNDVFVISGIDGFKVTAKKHQNITIDSQISSDSHKDKTTGGGVTPLSFAFSYIFTLQKTQVFLHLITLCFYIPFYYFLYGKNTFHIHCLIMFILPLHLLFTKENNDKYS